MKGKLAFVLGAAVGYVLGTRAGRERYEQIKRGAQRVWETEPVQRGVHLVKDAVDERAEEFKTLALRFGGDVFSNLVKGRSRSGGAPADRGERRAAAEADGADGRADGSATESSDSARSSSAGSGAAKSSAGKSSSARSTGAKSGASGAAKKTAASKSASTKAKSGSTAGSKSSRSGTGGTGSNTRQAGS